MKNKKFNIIYFIFTSIFIVILATFMNLREISNTNCSYSGETIIYKNLNSASSLSKAESNSNVLSTISVDSKVKHHGARIKVYPGGQPVGIKLNTDGVLVVGLSDIQGKNGEKLSPAAEAGIQIGDSIVKINGETIKNSKNLIDKVNKNEKLNIVLLRKGKSIVKTILPLKSSIDGNYKLGIWVRDSTAGVGTLTFYDKVSGKFAALGHPITDVDTGTVLKVKDGSLINSTIISVKKGIKGDPGEIRGIFINEEQPIGNISNNTMCGIYGDNFKMGKNKEIKPIEVAFNDEIKEGNAKILTTINGEEPKYYDIKIEKLFSQEAPGPKSMVIKVTDPELLKKTGGIVQGMSGSPIIQNNRIVGAVTHVLINNPDTGYGIYVEWMLKEAGMIK
jgi:stage IV sporulation protein B